MGEGYKTQTKEEGESKFAGLHTKMNSERKEEKILFFFSALSRTCYNYSTYK